MLEHQKLIKIIELFSERLLNCSDKDIFLFTAVAGYLVELQIRQAKDLTNENHA